MLNSLLTGLIYELQRGGTEREGPVGTDCILNSIYLIRGI